MPRLVSLQAVARDPSVLRELPTPMVAAVASHATAVLLERMAAAGAEAGEDRLLTAEEVAPIVGLSARYLRRHAASLPFTVRPTPGRVRFSLRGAHAWVAQKARTA